MKIQFTTDMPSVEALLMKEAETVEKETLDMLAFIGEKCVNEARDRPSEESWIDQTHNLRSSIGYEVTKNGEAVTASNFNAVMGGGEGSAKGKAFAHELAKRLDSDYGLVVVAGMDYASYVEDMDNKVVLASAELLAVDELRKQVRELNRKLNSKSA